MRFYSPLRYPGGKSKLTKHIIKLFELNNYSGGTYIEPFAGGAGIALALLYGEYVERVCINDLDISIHSLWYSIINHTDELCRLIIDTPVTVEEWKKQKEIQSTPSKVSILELGFSTFFLNRTNISGIIKGGMIGGYSQSGKYKIDARFNKKNLVRRIEKIGMYRDRIDIHNLCAKNLIDGYISNNESRCFIYFDPPYYCKGPELYKNHLSHNDHIEISNSIKKIDDHYWIVTYDNVPEITDMYSELRAAEYTLNYSAGNASKGKEVMFFSNNLEVYNENNKIKVVL